MKELLSIKGLSVNFYTYEGIVHALDNLTLDIYNGETLGLVGETGCGKTMTAFAILRLILPPGKIENGNIYLYNDGDRPIDLLAISESEIRSIRGSQISMVFQEPGSALNPVYTIGDQITEVILLHRRQEMAKYALETVTKLLSGNNSIISKLTKPSRLIQKKILKIVIEKPKALLPRFIERIPLARGLLWRLDDEANKIAISLLKEVEIADPNRVIKQHPHQLSGGMKQRIIIAMALACHTQLLMADEPTTALDVTIQAQILELLKKLKKEFKSSILYITHDLAVAAEMCDRVAVMYSGSLCEIASVDEVYAKPLHPYTRALMASVPKPGKKLYAIGGSVPDPLELPTGCHFHPRCKDAKEICKEKPPDLVQITPGHLVACHLYKGDRLGQPNRNP